MTRLRHKNSDGAEKCKQCLPHASLVCNQGQAICLLYRDAARNEWDAGEEQGLKYEGLNGVIGLQSRSTLLVEEEHVLHPVKTVKIKNFIIFMLNNREWYLLQIPPCKTRKIEIHDVQKQ
ncbi:Sterol 3-beta-glucosyltransferase UGT80B1 [Fusarium oxysporum f. sp. albedinis]|nr:Sterol 3-beta-glucosyltransferase UGT80B1 [Fusarium oxysporum f. sp. albedinis]